MELATGSPAAAPGTPEDAGRRKSGRVTKRPDLLADQLGIPAKRKRTNEDGEAESDAESGAADDAEHLDMEIDDEEEEEQGDDDEEGKTRRRAKKGAQGKQGKPRAAKKPKVDAGGNERSIPIRGTKGRARPKKAVRFSSATDAGGLFGEF
jgi:cohesin complex subunit SA-1/2